MFSGGKAQDLVKALCTYYLLRIDACLMFKGEFYSFLFGAATVFTVSFWDMVKVRLTICSYRPLIDAFIASFCSIISWCSKSFNSVLLCSCVSTSNWCFENLSSESAVSAYNFICCILTSLSFSRRSDTSLQLWIWLKIIANFPATAKDKSRFIFSAAGLIRIVRSLNVSCPLFVVKVRSSTVGGDSSVLD